MIWGRIEGRSEGLNALIRTLKECSIDFERIYQKVIRQDIKSPAKVSKANMVILPERRESAAVLKVPGHMIPTESPAEEKFF